MLEIGTTRGTPFWTCPICLEFFPERTKETVFSWKTFSWEIPHFVMFSDRIWNWICENVKCFSFIKLWVCTRDTLQHKYLYNRKWQGNLFWVDVRVLESNVGMLSSRAHSGNTSRSVLKCCVSVHSRCEECFFFANNFVTVCHSYMGLVKTL